MLIKFTQIFKTYLFTYVFYAILLLQNLLGLLQIKTTLTIYYNLIIQGFYCISSMHQSNQQINQYYVFKQPNEHYHKRFNKTQRKRVLNPIISHQPKQTSQKSKKDDYIKVKHLSIRRLEKSQSHPNIETNINCHLPLNLKVTDIPDRWRQLGYRTKRSPFKRILKSASCCQTLLYDHIERVANVIRQEEIARERRKLHQKAFKLQVLVPTYSELNSLKKTKNIGVNLELLSQKERQRIWRQRVECYFSRKQESQINHNKVLNLLSSICACHSCSTTPLFSPRFPSLPTSNLSSLKTPTINSIHRQFFYKQNLQIQQPSYSDDSGGSSQSSSSLTYEQSDYGFKIGKIDGKRLDGQQQLRWRCRRREEDEIIRRSSKQAGYELDESERGDGKHLSNFDYNESSITNELKMSSLQHSDTSRSSIQIDSKIKNMHFLLKNQQGNSENSNNSMISVSNQSNLRLDSKKQIPNEKVSDCRRKQTPIEEVRERDIMSNVDLKHACVINESKQQQAIRFIKVGKKNGYNIAKQIQKFTT